MAEEPDNSNGVLHVPHIEELANGKEPFMTASKAARIYHVHYSRILLGVRLGELNGVAFMQKERGKGLQALIPVSEMARWAEERHERERLRTERRSERRAKQEQERTARREPKQVRPQVSAHMAMMREALRRKRAAAKQGKVFISREEIDANAIQSGVEESLKNLSKREVYAILAALERLAQVHAERAEKDKG